MTPTPEPDPDLIAAAGETFAMDVPNPNRDAAWDIVDQWGEQSFPASDPPANW
jgi:hypothetical protein